MTGFLYKTFNVLLCFFGSVNYELTITLHRKIYMMADTLKIKEDLVEDVGVYFEKMHQIPPLAARIYSWLMLCPADGHSFDEIIELTQSSKSSISTNLNLLLKTGSVEYFTKPGDRKRYFRLSKNYLEVTLKQYEEKVSEELKLIKKIDKFNKRHNKVKHEKHKCFGKLYRAYLESHYKNLETTIRNMNNLEKSV